MTDQQRADRLFQTWLESEAPNATPDGLLDRVDSATRSARPRPTLVARLRGHHMDVIVGGRRTGVPRLSLVLVIIAALVAAVAVVAFIASQQPSIVVVVPSQSPGVANDAPCSRTLPAGSLALAPMPFHHEDLESMVLTRADVGGLAGFEPDVSAEGFHDNVEVTSLVPNPSTTCDDVQRLGRLEGYGNVFTNYDDGRQVQFDVHLFWKAEDSASWIEAFTSGLATEVAATGGAATFEQAPLGVELADATLWIHTGGDGTRTWVILQRGPIVGWIVDLHPDEATTIDVPAAAVLMADRIEMVEAELPVLARRPLDVAQLISAPLSKAAYGDLAATFAWDWFFGGCQDTAERGFIAGDQAREDAIRFNRISGCTAMYAPPGGGGASGAVVRVFSSVNVHADSELASGALEASVGGQEAKGGVRFAAAGIGDEAIGITTPATPGESGGPADTRVVLRIGTLMAFVSIQGHAAPDSQAIILDLARQLDARIRAVLASG